MTDNLNPEHVAWCKQIFGCLKDGGVWAIPRSGLLFRRQGAALALIAVMPHMEDMPITAAQLAKQQDSDYADTVVNFGAAGVAVRMELT